MIWSNENKIVLVGLSGAGKSTLTEELAKKFSGYKLFHTDQYLQFGDYGSDAALAQLLRDVMNIPGKIIVEGSLCYRLLKYGWEYNIFIPDMIINVVATAEDRSQRRPGKDYSQMDRMYRSMWYKFLELMNEGGGKVPRIVEWNTSVVLQEKI